MKEIDVFDPGSGAVAPDFRIAEVGDAYCKGALATMWYSHVKSYFKELFEAFLAHIFFSKEVEGFSPEAPRILGNKSKPLTSWQEHGRELR